MYLNQFFPAEKTRFDCSAVKFIDDVIYGMTDVDNLISQLANLVASGEVVLGKGHIERCSICGDNDSFILWVRDRQAIVYDESFEDDDEDWFPGYLQHDISFCSECCGR